MHKVKKDINRRKEWKLKIVFESQSNSSNSEITLDISYKSKESNSHYKESNCYDQKVVSKLRERLKEEMNKICKKYGFNYKLLRLIVGLDFDPDLYCKLKVNGIMYNYKFYRD